MHKFSHLKEFISPLYISNIIDKYHRSYSVFFFFCFLSALSTFAACITSSYLDFVCYCQILPRFFKASLIAASLSSATVCSTIFPSSYYFDYSSFFFFLSFFFLFLSVFFASKSFSSCTVFSSLDFSSSLVWVTSTPIEPRRLSNSSNSLYFYCFLDNCGSGFFQIFSIYI